MKLYFVRHGQSQANVLGIFSNRGWQHGLTAEGVRQAQALADRLQAIDERQIFTSPLRRAVETAEILGNALALEYEPTDALREYDCGVIEGTSTGSSRSIYGDVSDDWIRHGRWDARIEGGESFLEMRDRFVPFIEGLIGAAEGDERGVILVAHGGILRCMLPLVLENVDFDYAMARGLGYATVVVAQVRGRGLICLDWAGVAPPCDHLTVRTIRHH